MTEVKKKTFLNSVNWPALASATGDGADIDIGALCALGQAMSSFFEQLGVAFKSARSDVAGNVRKMSDAARQLSVDGSRPPAVGDLLRIEAEAGTAQKDPSGTVGILWFKRALEYLYAVLCLLRASRARPDDFGMSGLCRRAYEATLRPRHPWVVQKTFGVVMSAAPYRSTFLSRLAFGDSSVTQAEIYESMAEGLVAMRRLLDCLNAVLCRYNAEVPPLPDLDKLTELPADSE